MGCGHKYYHRVDGKLLCDQCGEPSPNPDAFAKLITQPEENKVEEPADTGAVLVEGGGIVWPPETKRIKKRGRKKTK